MMMMMMISRKITNLGRATEIARRILRAHEVGEGKYLIELEVLHLQTDHASCRGDHVDEDDDRGAYGDHGRVWIEFKGVYDGS